MKMNTPAATAKLPIITKAKALELVSNCKAVLPSTFRKRDSIFCKCSFIFAIVESEPESEPESVGTLGFCINNTGIFYLISFLVHQFYVVNCVDEDIDYDMLSSALNALVKAYIRVMISSRIMHSSMANLDEEIANNPSYW